MTTYTSYGHIDENRQGDIIKSFKDSSQLPSDLDAETLKKIASLINNKGVL
jgi:hypothetical protein